MKRTVLAEQFYTPAAIVDNCLELISKHYSLDDFDLLLEPSAGSGAFLSRLPESTRLGIDILPAHPEVTRQDFLTFQPELSTGKVMTIGNPPFGQRGSLAVKFIERAALFSDVIAFVLPRSFRKYTFQNRVPLNFHLIDQLDCDAFVTASGNPLTVKSVFQVWERRSAPRERIAPQRTHADFEMRHAHLSKTTRQQFGRLCAEFDFAIPQVGAAFHPRDPRSLARGSYWFIRANAPGVRETFERLDFAFLDGMNTAHKSLSKADIIAAYISAVGGDDDSASSASPPSSLASVSAPKWAELSQWEG